jgi:hypothetical protein
MPPRARTTLRRARVSLTHGPGCRTLSSSRQHSQQRTLLWDHNERHGLEGRNKLPGGVFGVRVMDYKDNKFSKC